MTQHENNAADIGFQRDGMPSDLFSRGHGTVFQPFSISETNLIPL